MIAFGLVQYVHFGLLLVGVVWFARVFVIWVVGLDL